MHRTFSHLDGVQQGAVQEHTAMLVQIRTLVLYWTNNGLIGKIVVCFKFLVITLIYSTIPYSHSPIFPRSGIKDRISPDLLLR